MPIAITTNTQISYVLERERAKTDGAQTVFFIRPLSKRQMLTLSDFPGDDKSAGVARADHIVKCGLVGWKNFCDGLGKEILFDINQIDDLLTLADYRELANAILISSSLSVDDEKKSESPQGA